MTKLVIKGDERPPEIIVWLEYYPNGQVAVKSKPEDGDVKTDIILYPNLTFIHVAGSNFKEE